MDMQTLRRSVDQGEANGRLYFENFGTTTDERFKLPVARANRAYCTDDAWPNSAIQHTGRTSPERGSFPAK
jgi:hypothetical protein